MTATDPSRRTPAEDAAEESGKHAVVRPEPAPPPEPVAEPVVEPAPAPPADPGSARAVPPDVTPDDEHRGTAPAEPAGPAAHRAPATDDDRLFPDPNAPVSASVGRHVLAVLVGLLLGPLAAGVLLLGQGRVLGVQADGWNGDVDTLGITLVLLGTLLAALVVLLARWSAAVPVTAGILLTAAGAVALVAPGLAQDGVLRAVGSGTWRLTAMQTTVAGTSGLLLAVGALVLVAGWTAASTRRAGRRLGAFRERHHPTGDRPAPHA